MDLPRRPQSLNTKFLHTLDQLPRHNHATLLLAGRLGQSLFTCELVLQQIKDLDSDLVFGLASASRGNMVGRIIVVRSSHSEKLDFGPCG